MKERPDDLAYMTGRYLSSPAGCCCLQARRVLDAKPSSEIQPRKVKERGDGDCPLAPLARVRSEKSLHARLHLIEAHPPARAVSRSRSDSRRTQTVRTARATVGQISEQLAFLNSSSRHRLLNLLRSAAPLR